MVTYVSLHIKFCAIIHQQFDYVQVARKWSDVESSISFLKFLQKHEKSFV